MRPELVIFDCDGVLVDSEPLAETLIAANLTRHGLPLEPRDVNALFVGGTVYGVRDEATLRGATLPPNWPDEMYGEIYAGLAEGVPVMPGVMDLLDALHAKGVALAVASNGPQRKMEITLRPSGLWDRFAPHIHSAHDEGRPKPDPHMLQKAMAEAGTTPERTVFIDDSVTGASAGLAAGVMTLGFDPTGTRRYPPGIVPVTGFDAVCGLLDL